MVLPSEAGIEEALLAHSRALRYGVAPEGNIAPDSRWMERGCHDDVMLWKRAGDTVAGLNQGLSVEAHQGAVRRVFESQSAGLADSEHPEHKDWRVLMRPGELSIRHAQAFIHAHAFIKEQGL